MNNQNNIEERQNYYVERYKKIHNTISVAESQINELISIVSKLTDELENLREQEKIEFNYGKEK
jgi:hypothetical protein